MLSSNTVVRGKEKKEKGTCEELVGTMCFLCGQGVRRALGLLEVHVEWLKGGNEDE